MSRSVPLLSGGGPEVPGESQVVVLAVEQAAGQRVVLSHQLAAAGGGLAGTDHRGRVVAGDLLGEGGRIGGLALADCLADPLLHRGDGLGGLSGPAPLPVRRGVADGLKLAEGVGAAKLVAGVDVGVVWRPGVVHGDTRERWQDAHRLDRLPAALGVHREQGYLPVRAQCTQRSRPSIRNPVSSNPATPLAVMFPRTRSRKPSSFPAARAVMAATVPDDSGTPNSSASACAVRFLDRNCPMYR